MSAYPEKSPVLDDGPEVDPFYNDPFFNDPFDPNRPRRTPAPQKFHKFVPEPEPDYRTVKGTFVEFAETTTLHGVPRLVMKNTGIWPYIWAVIIPFVSAVYFYMFTSVIVKFFQYPVNTDVNVVYKEVEFPAISICNMNNLRKSEVDANPAMKLAIDAFDANIKSQLQGSEDGSADSSSGGRRKRAAREAFERRKRALKCGVLNCPGPGSRVGFWPFTSKYTGYDLSGFDNKAYLSPSVAYASGPTGLPNGAIRLAGARHSHLEIANNGALDVKTDMTWVGYVRFHNISRDAPIFVWMPHPDYCKTFNTGLSARIRQGRINLHFTALRCNYDIAGIYAFEAALVENQWHLIAVNYDTVAGTISFRLDDQVIVKQSNTWKDQYHDTQTSVRIGAYPIGGPEYLSDSSLDGDISCFQLFNKAINLTTLEDEIEVLPCQCVNNSCIDPTTTTTTTTQAPVNFTTVMGPVGPKTEETLVDKADAYFVPEAEIKAWYNEGSPDAAVQNQQNFSRLLRTLSLEDRREMGHKLETLLQECSYDSMTCSPLNFTGFTNGKFGNCYTFNSGQNPEQPRLNATQSGALYGLVLTLYIEQHEYVGALSNAAGVRVLVHGQGVQPFPEDSDGFDVMPGMMTSVSVKKRDYRRLGQPYSDCTDGSEVELMYNRDYSDGACRRSCWQTAVLQDCGCGQASLPIPANTSVCLSDPDILCAQSVLNKYADEEYTCQCPTICNEFKFITSIATSEWPGKAFEEEIIETFSARDEMIANILAEKGAIRKNFLQLQVFYDDIMYEVVQQSPAYDDSSLMADIGGQLGLWLGLSCLTIVEIFQLIIDLCLLCCQQRKRVDPQQQRLKF